MQGVDIAARRSGTDEVLPDASGFDFLHGRWSVRHSKLRKRLEDCRDWYEFPGTLEVGAVLGNVGNFDYNHLADPAGTFEAHSLRLFMPATGEWSVWWLDSRNPGAGLGPAVVGRFEGTKVTLFGDDEFEGRKIRVRTTYESRGASTAQWTQAFLHHGGLWEVNWVMDFSRVAA
jgi:hypothetical protein